MRRVLTLALAGALAACPALGFQQIGASIDGSAEEDLQGTSLAMSNDGTRLAIGAPNNDAGRVRLFFLNEPGGGAWEEVAEIPGVAENDRFGAALAMSSDGTRLAVGGLKHDGTGTNAGHVRVFGLSAGALTRVGDDIHGEAAGDNFGISVAMSSDGTRLAVGATYNDAAGLTDAGHVRVFDLSDDTTAWNQVGDNIDGVAEGDGFGVSVQLSGDGARVAAGAQLNGVGNVRVFELNADGSEWIQVGNTIEGESENAYCGYSVSLSGDGSRVAVSSHRSHASSGQNAGRVRVFDLNAEAATWVQSGANIDGEAFNDRFGRSLSLSKDGTRLAVGARFNVNENGSSGHTRLFQAPDWKQVGADIDGEADGDNFGWAVHLSGDGARLAVGAPWSGGAFTDAGRVRVFQISCSTDERVSSNTCVACAPGLTNDAGDITDGEDSTCDAIICGANERVKSNACVACASGETNTAGDDASGADTACEATICAEDTRVKNHACVACGAGTTNDAGDDASGANTVCDPTFCVEDTRVRDHECVPCAAGETNPAGDDASGNDTACSAILCGADHHVASHACVPCAAGYANDAGDDASGIDTVCDEIICGVDEFVLENTCATCPPGTTNADGGDLASGAGTACDKTLCASNEHVIANACFPCDANATNRAGDDASGDDTPCDGELCPSNEHVRNHTCVPCAPGTTRDAGDDSLGADTACVATVCGADQHVASHVCVSCAGGSTNLDGGHDASGEDTSCACASLERVVGYACVACAAGETNAAGDPVPGVETRCDPTLCAEHSRVLANMCEVCPPGMTNAAGDDASGEDTFCDEVICGANEFVSEHACVACPPGMTRAEGDAAAGNDTACDASPCDANERVEFHACVPCVNATNSAGDDPSGPDTVCHGVLCASNERVRNHACVPCAPGTTNAAGDDSLGEDTACAATVCGTNERVERNACVPCAGNSTNPEGRDDASGGDTTCACGVNERVYMNACVPCAADETNAAGDRVPGADTTCVTSTVAAPDPEDEREPERDVNKILAVLAAGVAGALFLLAAFFMCIPVFDGLVVHARRCLCLPSRVLTVKVE